MSNKITQRNSNLECLRILCMLIIVMHHFVYSTGVLDTVVSINRFFASCYNLGGKLGVNIFVLISGYFLCEKDFKFERLLKVWLPCIFYSLLFMCVAFVWEYEKVTMINILKSIFPVITNMLWFVTAYIGLYICSPFLNFYIKKASCHNHKIILVVLTVHGDMKM